MSKIWRLRVWPELRESIEQGAKTIELRIETDRNRWLIKEMLEYQIGDRLDFEFAKNRVVEGDPIQTKITQPTSTKKFVELDDEEIQKVTGLIRLNREGLRTKLESLYRQQISGETEIHLAHFTK